MGGGGGGYVINIMGQKDTLKIEGEDNISTYAVTLPDGQQSGNVRSFCGKCGSMLWCYDEHWSQWMYPFTSCIDTELPKPPHSCHIFLADKPAWIDADVKDGDQTFDGYPNLSIEQWHKNHNCWID